MNIEIDHDILDHPELQLLIDQLMEIANKSSVTQHAKLSVELIAPYKPDLYLTNDIGDVSIYKRSLTPAQIVVSISIPMSGINLKNLLK